MSVPFVPNAFVDGENLDVNKVNHNLTKIGADLDRTIARRYTYGSFRWDLAGLTDGSNVVFRTFPLRRFEDVAAMEVMSVEVNLYGNTAVTATLTCSDTTIPVLTWTTVASTTTEVTASIGIPVSIPSEFADVTWTLAFSGAYTITDGEIIFHTRCDRRNQGLVLARYIPTLLNSVSTSATTGVGALLDAEFAAITTASNDNQTFDQDMRAELFMTRNLAAAASVTFRVPSGLRRIRGGLLYVVAAATETGSVDITGGITAINATLVGAGPTTLAVVAFGPGVDHTQADDPTDATDDLVVVLSDAGAATAVLIAVILFFD